MAGTINKVILIGNLGRDPEIRRIDNGTAVATFSIATTETYKDKTTGETKSLTDWHNIVLWRGLAEIAEKYLKKGNKVYIEGKLRTRQYVGQDNITRYITEVIGEELVLLSSPQSTSSSSYVAPPPPSEMPADLSTPSDDLPF
ncbi:MAG: single-stranded DNA-binding protein [Cytophagales bacterium]|nr:single-stranded DNA-binding protein [Cytophagales bacterium]MDW8384509.1 single-stranded DNA-binding protein [Flammeovirgaceae bacterium]